MFSPPVHLYAPVSGIARQRLALLLLYYCFTTAQRDAPVEPRGVAEGERGLKRVVRGRRDLRREARVEELCERLCALVDGVIWAVEDVAVAPHLRDVKAVKKRKRRLF